MEIPKLDFVFFRALLYFALNFQFARHNKEMVLERTLNAEMEY